MNKMFPFNFNSLITPINSTPAIKDLDNFHANSLSIIYQV